MIHEVVDLAGLLLALALAEVHQEQDLLDAAILLHILLHAGFEPLEALVVALQVLPLDVVLGLQIGALVDLGYLDDLDQLLHPLNGI